MTQNKLIYRLSDKQRALVDAAARLIAELQDCDDLQKYGNDQPTIDIEELDDGRRIIYFNNKKEKQQ